MQSQLYFTTAERKNWRLNGNSAKITSVEKHSFRLIYQSQTSSLIRKCRLPEISLQRNSVALTFDFRSELMLIFQISKYCHIKSFSLKRYEKSQYMLYRSIAFIIYVSMKKPALYFRLSSSILLRT